MTYNEFIARPIAHKRRILHKIEDVRLKEAACTTSTTPLKERVQSSVNNAAEINIIRYAEAKKDLERLFEGLEAVQNEVRIFLYANLTPIEADTMEWKYIDDKNIRQIADITNSSYDCIKSRIKRADKKARRAYEFMQASEIDPL